MWPIQNLPERFSWPLCMYMPVEITEISFFFRKSATIFFAVSSSFARNWDSVIWGRALFWFRQYSSAYGVRCFAESKSVCFTDSSLGMRARL